ncbi:alcohol dehydrogenase (cytochrome c) [Tistlia consotensis]|uniref:Alcohol dehydrogenase (Cytochrome c) n=1 Tax=Tistlia consotensis USBA 355 TaxID=560819 RepID=A0A1Y6CM86_9PROT|nr:PQQ-binding-like beta-propeller repeat protein [Tistlia consotensis]SMF77218.1 alcohol dehydrogenase (cytochrome c) [Tistlia consotensis USBA 355]SNS14458.1 alcohol dehydrogenase (cytochrome c) [Tistlia consotensis]
MQRISTLFRGALLAGAALALPGLALAASGNASGPSSDMLLKAADDSASWILPAGSYSGDRSITESQISPQNVGKMTKAWSFTIPAGGPVEASPIVWHGMMYVTSFKNDVYALDAKTGELKWQYNPKPMQLVGFPRNRGVAILDGVLFMGMANGHMVALDAETGKEIWNKQTVENPKNSFYSMQPVPYKGKLLMGVSNGDWGGIGNISAFDPKTGKRIWKWEAVPGPGQKGHDTWSGDSWKRGGGAIWSGLAIDPKTDTLYVDTGNPQPDFLGTIRKGKNLYTDSMVALDISGAKPKMKWYHQFIPHDTHDWDPAMPPVLFEGKVDGKEKPLVAAGDKGGNFWILDATTGKLVSHTPVSYQMGQNTEPPAVGANYACPNTNGGIEYNGGAYDPATNTFFVPSTNQCGKWTGSKKAVYVAGQFYLGGGFPSLVGPNSGWFNAVDVSTGVFSWRHHLGLPANGGALVMDYKAEKASAASGSLVFTGLLDGTFAAYDPASGKELWHSDMGGSIVAPPATFTMDGRRYVTVEAGDPGFLKVPELGEPAKTSTLTAFVSAAPQTATSN